MKPLLPAALIASSMLAGCAHKTAVLDAKMAAADREQSAFDRWSVESAEQASIKASVLEQHAIYPYHFVAGSVALTELGRRDIDLLAQGYKENPGPLTLVKGDTADELYASRKDAVLAALKGAGAGTVTIVDGPVGGLGITGNTAVLDRKVKAVSYSGSNTDTGSGTTTGSDVAKGENP